MKITDKFFVLNNSGHVSGNARKYSGYRHIALMVGDDSQTIIRNTKRARVIADATLFVGSLRGYGLSVLDSYEDRAAAANARLDAQFTKFHESEDF